MHRLAAESLPGNQPTIHCDLPLHRANASKVGHELEKERIVESCYEALALEAELSGMAFEDVESEMTQDDEVLGTIFDAQTGIILAKDHIQ